MNKDNYYTRLREMSGGSLTQLQVNASEKIMIDVDLETLSDAIGLEKNNGYMLTASKLRKVSSKVDVSFVDIINKHAATFGITDKKRMSMFIAHALHESNSFNTLQESFNYSYKRLRVVFGWRVPTDDLAKSLVKQGKMAIANHVYGGRYGNNNLMDGWLYSGKGLGGLTFRDNYEKMQKVMRAAGLEYDIVNNPMLLLDKEVATLSYMAYWKDKNLNAYADSSDVNGATRVINGGTNGLADRQQYYKKCISYL